MSKKFEIKTTQNFRDYVEGLRDPLGKAAILAKLKRIEMGNWGDVVPAGDGLSEVRIHKGPGYRIYCKKVDNTVVVVLCAGTKNGQQADINAALAEAKAI